MNTTLLTILVLFSGASGLVVWLSVSAPPDCERPASRQRVVVMALLFGGVAVLAWVGGFDWMFL